MAVGPTHYSLWHSTATCGPFGAAMAKLTFWLMVTGVAGVVVTTVFLGFAGSWVFLYPLPFYSAGQWGDVTTALFSFSVLLAGLAIVTWCVGILHTIVGPALHAVASRGSIGGILRDASRRRKSRARLGSPFLGPRGASSIGRASGF